LDQKSGAATRSSIAASSRAGLAASKIAPQVFRAFDETFGAANQIFDDK
jgi:hypothetical protein